MASTAPVRHARQALLWLGIIHLVLFAVLVSGVVMQKASFAPKLALDLEGGTEMILTPKTDDPNAEVTPDQLSQAVAIIRQRVDGTGVSEAHVTTQNNRNIVVSMPGTPSTETRNLIQSSAQMQFRPVLVGLPSLQPVPEAQRTKDDQLPKPQGKPENGSDLKWIDANLQKKFEAWDCAAEAAKPNRETFKADQPMIACEPSTGMRYILGPLEVSGGDITEATSGQEQNSQGFNTGRWSVNLSFNAAGTEAFKQVTSRLTSLESPRNQFGIVLDGTVISAPQSSVVISDGRSSITGSFTQESAKELAEQLKYGALPMSFAIDSEQQVSATLGTDQLKMGLIAGLIGLILVAAYSFFQYRLLGLVTIASLVIAGVLTYLAIALLGWSANYRLSLAGVAGIIVAIGLTADSFIVYFERIRDELREGKNLTAAVEAGWARAKRTILASKAVNLLAAVVLYFVSVGNVKGFAFTLGLTAVADLVVVFLFTHPVLRLLAQTRFFGEGHRLSGLDPSLLGAEPLYKGAGQVRQRREPVAVGAGAKAQAKTAGASREAQRRMTIAERRRAEELERRAKGEPVSTDDAQAKGGDAVPSGSAKDQNDSEGEHRG